MSITVRAIDLRALQFVASEDLRATALYLLRLQRQRIESGIGQDGAPMRPYTPEYAEYRREKGRTTDKRTLLFTSAMLAARQLKEITKTRAVIGWSDAVQILKALGNQARTPFVKATPDEIQKVSAFLKDRARKRLKTEQARLRAAKGKP